MKKFITERIHLHLHGGSIFGLLSATGLFWAMDFTDLPVFFRLLVLYGWGAFWGFLWEKYWHGKGAPTSWPDVHATAAGFALGYPLCTLEGLELWQKIGLLIGTFCVNYAATQAYRNKERVE